MMIGSLYQSDIPKTVTASSPELNTKHNSTHFCRSFFFTDNHDTAISQSHIASLFSCKKKARIRRRSLVLIIAVRFGNRSPVATKPTPDFTSSLLLSLPSRHQSVPFVARTHNQIHIFYHLTEPSKHAPSHR
jgi:hypothetical protein